MLTSIPKPKLKTDGIINMVLSIQHWKHVNEAKCKYANIPTELDVNMQIPSLPELKTEKLN